MLLHIIWWCDLSAIFSQSFLLLPSLPTLHLLMHKQWRAVSHLLLSMIEEDIHKSVSDERNCTMKVKLKLDSKLDGWPCLEVFEEEVVVTSGMRGRTGTEAKAKIKLIHFWLLYLFERRLGEILSKIEGNQAGLELRAQKWGKLKQSSGFCRTYGNDSHIKAV